MPGRVIVAIAFASIAWVTVAQSSQGELDQALKLVLAGRHGDALMIVEPLAKGGDARAQTYLGKMYLGGQGVPKDGAAAVEWLRRAAEQDYREAQFVLGGILGAGLVNVPIDHIEGLKWLILAKTQDGLAYKLLTEEMTATDISEAKKRASTWRKKANQGKLKAALALPLGDSVQILADLSDQGLAGAQYELGMLYALGVPDAIPSKTFLPLPTYQPDPQKATDLFAKAALQGHAKAQTALANALLRGDGVEEDHKNAVRWLEKAAAQSEQGAMLRLADMLVAGDGVRTDRDRGYSLYRAVARSGDPYAMERLGQGYTDGTIGERDFELAYLWLSLASREYRANFFDSLAEKADKLRHSNEELMSQQQIDRAKEAAGHCAATSYIECRKLGFWNWLYSWVSP